MMFGSQPMVLSGKKRATSPIGLVARITELLFGKIRFGFWAEWIVIGLGVGMFGERCLTLILRQGRCDVKADHHIFSGCVLHWQVNGGIKDAVTVVGMDHGPVAAAINCSLI